MEEATKLARWVLGLLIDIVDDVPEGLDNLLDPLVADCCCFVPEALQVKIYRRGCRFCVRSPCCEFLVCAEVLFSHIPLSGIVI